MNDYILCEKCQSSVRWTDVHEGMCANCHLDKIILESAAQDLLDTCQSVLVSLKKLEADDLIDGCIMILRAAIAKAKGKS